MKKCYTVTKRERLDTDREDTWNDDNLKALNYIYGAISNKQLEFVSDKETAFEVMKKFDELYLKESTALQIICRNKLDKLRLKDYSETATFFSDFEKIVNELKAAGAKVNEKEKLNYMLRTLPESLSYIGDLVDVLREEDQTVEYEKSKVRLMDEKNKDGSEGAKSNAFHAERKSGTRNQEQLCFGCGKPGHFKRDCRQGEENSRGTWKHGYHHHGNRQRGGYGHGQRGGYGNGQRGGYGNGGQRGGYGNGQRGGYGNGQRGSRGGRYHDGRAYQQSEVNTMSSFVTEVQCMLTRNEIVR